MKTIHKYPLNINEIATQTIMGIKTYSGTRLLHVGLDPKDRLFYVWALVETAHKPVVRTIIAYGTGAQIDSLSYDFVGTIITPEGMVWHIFDMRESKV